jgi:hypothetical protein
VLACTEVEKKTLPRCEGCYFLSDIGADKYGTKSFYSRGHHGEKTKFFTK